MYGPHTFSMDDTCEAHMEDWHESHDDCCAVGFMHEGMEPEEDELQLAAETSNAEASATVVSFQTVIRYLEDESIRDAGTTRRPDAVVPSPTRPEPYRGLNG
jgi:hypothetical protein